MERKVLVATLVATCCALCGCSRRDALKDFKGVVQAFSSAPDGGYVTPRLNMKATPAEELRFDVEKTDSLVSPFIATVDYSRHMVWDEHPHERYTYKWKATFAYQENQWVVKEVEWLGGDGPTERYFFIDADTKRWQAALDRFYKKKSN